MVIHIYDIIGWIVVLLIYWWILPKDYKEELGVILGWFGGLIITIIWIIIFGVIDLNISDLLDSISLFNSPLEVMK